MKDRCLNPNSKYWERYGGRGIRICEEWANDFSAFYSWAIDNGYRDDLTIDRRDNDGDYCPENCRWATYLTQENNRSNNVLFRVGGEKITLAQLARKEDTTRALAEKKHKEEKVNGNK